MSRRIDLVYRAHQGSTVQHEIQYFELTFRKKHREMVVESYLPFVIDEAKSLRPGKKTLKLYTPNSNGFYSGAVLGTWAPVNLDHPAMFNTLAMDLELKKKILDDLDRFVRRKEYYRRVGKA
ncbi:hypothetical protein NL676_006311 [Syzygium grande]|nr:hypothetical protein NL676_006311 [Syzygium grande]